MEIFDILDAGSFISIIVANLLSVYLLKKIDKQFKIITAYLLFTLIIQIIAYYLYTKATNNLFLFHIHTPIEFACVVTIIASQIKVNLMPVISKIIILAFLIFSVFSAFKLESIEIFNSIPRSVAGISIIVFCIIYFYYLFNDNTEVNLLKHPYFWLIGAWLIYFSGTLYLYIFANLSDTKYTFPIIHSVLNIFLNLVYTYVLWLGSKKSIS